MQNLKKLCPKCGREMKIQNITPEGYTWGCRCGFKKKKDPLEKKIERAKDDLYYAVLTNSKEREQYKKELDRLKNEQAGEESET